MEMPFLTMLAVLTFGAYFHVVMGFVIAMIASGAASAFHLMPLPLLAIEISLLTLSNSPVALFGHLRDIDWRLALPALVGMFPTLWIGIELLSYLNSSSAATLQIVLGATIAFGSLVVAVKPKRYERRSWALLTFLQGALAGFIGGMFGFTGPPLIYHLYRQPVEPVVVRITLIFMFMASSMIRLTVVGFQGGLVSEVWSTFLWIAPFVLGATYLGRRYPPRISARNVRRTAFAFLTLIGVGLMLSGVLADFR